MNRTRVMLIDDHAILRAGVKLMLGQQPDLDVVGEAASIAEALALAGTLEPEIVVQDLVLPGGGSAAIGQVRTAFPRARVVVLTMHDEPSFVDEAIAHGADGFVTKAAAASDLVLAIRAVSTGKTFFHVQAPPSRPAATPPEANPLSPRELEVLTHVASGYTNKEVGVKLDISVKTVETYRARIAEKAGLKSRVEMLRYALSRGLVGARRADDG